MMAEYVLRAERKDNSDGKNNVWIISLGQNILIKSMNIRQGAILESTICKLATGEISIH